MGGKGVIWKIPSYLLLLVIVIVVGVVSGDGGSSDNSDSSGSNSGTLTPAFHWSFPSQDLSPLSMDDIDEDDDDDEVLEVHIDEDEQVQETGKGGKDVKLEKELGHNITVIGDFLFDRRMECQGVNVTAFAVIACDSMTECEKKLPCLMNQRQCSVHDDVVRGKECPRVTYGWHRPNLFGFNQGLTSLVRISPEKLHSKDCFIANIPMRFKSGIVQCTSSNNIEEEGQKKEVITVDHFYTGHDLSHELVSKTHNSSDHMRMGVVYSGMDITREPTWKGTLYTNEPVIVHCRVPKFLYKQEGMSVRVIKDDGSKLNIDPELTISVGLHVFWVYGIEKFRVFKGVTGFSCHAQKANSSEWIEKTVNFTVVDPPSTFRVPTKTQSGRGYVAVRGPMGCKLEGNDLKEKHEKIQKIFDSPKEKVIDSTIEFLRFDQLANGAYSCVDIRRQNDTKDVYDYYIDFALKPPEIEKPRGRFTIKLDGEEHRTLTCNYSGDPQPYIIWMRNGQPLFYTLSKDGSEGNGTMEEVQLRLPISNLVLEFPLNNTDDSVTQNISCVAFNHLGTDRLDFIIAPHQPCGSSKKSEENFISPSNSLPSNKGYTNGGQKEEKLIKGESQSGSSSAFTLPLIALIVILCIGLFVLWRKYSEQKQLVRIYRTHGRDFPGYVPDDQRSRTTTESITDSEAVVQNVAENSTLTKIPQSSISTASEMGAAVASSSSSSSNHPPTSLPHSLGNLTKARFKPSDPMYEILLEDFQHN